MDDAAAVVEEHQEDDMHTPNDMFYSPVEKEN